MSSLVPNQLLKKPLRFCDGRDARPTILKAPPQARPARPRMPVDAGQVQLEIRSDPQKLKWVEQARLKFEKNRNPYGQYGQPYKIGDQFRDKYDPIADVGYGLSRVPVKFRRVRAPPIPQLSSAQAQACKQSAGFGDPSQEPVHIGNYSMDIKRAVNHNRPQGSAISNPTAPYKQNPRAPVDGYTTIGTRYTTSKPTISVTSKSVPNVTTRHPDPKGRPTALRARLEAAVAARSIPPPKAQAIPVPSRSSLKRYIDERVAVAPKIVAKPPITGGGGRVPVVAGGHKALQSRMNVTLGASAPARPTPLTTLPVVPDSVNRGYTMGRGEGPSVDPIYSPQYTPDEGATAHSQYISGDHYTSYSTPLSATAPSTIDVVDSVTAQRPNLERAYHPGGFDAREDVPQGPLPVSTPWMRNKGPATVGRGNFNISTDTLQSTTGELLGSRSVDRSAVFPSDTSRPRLADRYGGMSSQHPPIFSGSMINVEGYTDTYNTPGEDKCNTNYDVGNGGGRFSEDEYGNDDVEALLLRGPVDHPHPLGYAEHPGMVSYGQSQAELDPYSADKEYYYQNRTRFSAGLNGISRADQRNRELRGRIDSMRGPGWTDTADPILKRAWYE